MFVEDPNDLDEIERRIRFSEIAARYGRAIAAWETAPWTTEHELLRREGLTLPDPLQLNNDRLTEVLWEIIEHLARRGTYLIHTDHLSDRDLYACLWHEMLHEPTKDYSRVLEKHELTQVGSWSQWIDLCEGVDAEDAITFALYYADEDDRGMLAQWYPHLELPERCAPPFDRDRFLPRSLLQQLEEAGLKATPEQMFDHGLPLDYNRDRPDWLLRTDDIPF